MSVDIRDLPFPIRVATVEPLPDYCIAIRFEDGKEGIYDVAPLLDKGVFRRLRDIDTFNKVHVHLGTATWPGEIDIAPERLWTDCIPRETARVDA